MLAVKSNRFHPAILVVVLTAGASYAENPWSIPGTQVSRLTLGADLAGCTRDTDCKGARICQANACVEPPPGMAPASLAPLPPPFVPQVMSSGNEDVLLKMANYQIQMLQFQKLSLAGPIFVLAIAGAGLVAGAVVAAVSYYFSFAAVVWANAALPLAIGLTWLLSNISYNQRVDAAIREIRNSHRMITQQMPAVVAPVTVASF